MSEPQLTIENLKVAQARVPQPTWAALTAIQQRFVAAIVAYPEKTQGECALIAGVSKRRAKTGGASAIAAMPKVKAALDYLRAEVADKTATDAVYVVKRLRQNDELAWRKEDLPASNTALGLLGKAVGAFEKRIRISFDDPAAMLAQLKAMPKAERAKVIRSMLEDAAG